MGPTVPWLWLREFLLPESCVLCHQPRGRVPWWHVPPVVREACGRDDPHLCAGCWESLTERDPGRALLEIEPGIRVPVWTAQHTNPELVSLVGAWKYHGLRGVAAPLLQLLAESLPAVVPELPTATLLVPVPLHSRRRRRRGFNQAEVLARGLMRLRGGRLEAGVLRRRRSTEQQARQQDAFARARNLAGSFRASRAPQRPEPVLLVDDIITSGKKGVHGASPSVACFNSYCTRAPESGKEFC